MTGEESILVMNFTGAYETQGFYKKSACRFVDCRDLTGVNGFCSEEGQAAIERRITGYEGGIHFIDGGNFHYITYLMVGKIREPFTLVVFDHHTDMQPSAFQGLLSCGCWLKRTLDENRYLRNVILIGVDDGLAAEAREYEKSRLCIESGLCGEFGANEESEPHKRSGLYGKARPPETGRVHILTESGAANEREWPGALKALEKEIAKNVYVSIDKDAFCQEDALTDWDQGSMTLDQLEMAWLCMGKDRRLLGVDVCGEAKRDFSAPEAMSAADGVNDDANRRILEMFKSEVWKKPKALDRGK